MAFGRGVQDATHSAVVSVRIGRFVGRSAASGVC
jgi:hypothetical protein